LPCGGHQTKQRHKFWGVILIAGPPANVPVGKRQLQLAPPALSDGGAASMNLTARFTRVAAFSPQLFSFQPEQPLRSHSGNDPGVAVNLASPVEIPAGRAKLQVSAGHRVRRRPASAENTGELILE
jgi:hypothetical protein